ncbi:MAG: YHS domain-containing protein [Nitrospirae bacterium]|nr:YHS domain-containing protein [Nitrospirota bacterium]
MYRLILIVGLLVVAYFLLRSAIREFRGRKDQTLTDKNLMVQDPVCRMYVPRESAVAASIGGQTYYFCSRDCADTFQKQLSS